MFEEVNTDEAILKRMMDKVPSDLDKREGSIIHNSLAPIALELAVAYSNLDRFLEYTFAQADTPEEFMEKRVSEIGMYRKQPTKAIKKGQFFNDENKLIDIPMGSRFSIDDLNYRAVEKIDTGIYIMECEELGTVGNNAVGVLIPIDYIEGLATAKLGEIIQEGQDIEKGEDLYNRFIEKIQNPTTSGNSNHYKQWTLEVPGVGDALVFPTWNGPGTVKVVVVDSNKARPAETIIEEVRENIENNKPIGAQVTVEGAVEKLINISAKVELATSFNLNIVQELFKKNIEEYFKSIAFKKSYLSYAQVGNLLINTDGVVDYSDLKVNGDAKNISFGEAEIAVAGSVELGVQ